MSRTNYFHADLRCPSCCTEGHISFEADVGALDYGDYQIGDLVIKSSPLKPKRGKRPKPIGPALEVDWERPFWAVGLGRCPSCGGEVLARIEIRERRCFAAHLTTDNLDPFAWGQIDAD